MAIRFMDSGGDVYGSVGTSYVTLLTYWSSYSQGGGGGVGASVSAGSGRTGNSALKLVFPFTDSAFSIYKTVPPHATYGLALAFNPSSTSINSYTIMGLRDNSTNQVDVRILPGGLLSVTRNGTVLGTSTANIPANAYTHLELLATIHNTAGSVELRANGVTIIGPLTNVNTRATSNNYANIVFIGPNNASGVLGTWYYSDIVAYDGQTTDDNGYSDISTFVGDCVVSWLLPSGIGTTTQFSPTGSTDNYAAVDDTAPDGDTTYVSSKTVGATDTYALSNLPSNIKSVKSLMSVLYCRKDDAGARGVKPVIRSAGANATHATEIALGTSYNYATSVFAQDPNNGSPQPWTTTAVNALEVGQTLSS